jgi:hypothetical protein
MKNAVWEVEVLPPRQLRGGLDFESRLLILLEYSIERTRVSLT